MPVIFVHGVNVRKDNPDYKTRSLLIEKYLLGHLSGVSIEGKTLSSFKPRFPYWGDLGVSFAWNMASLPTEHINSLGSPGVSDDLRPLIAALRDSLADPMSAQDEPLLTLANKSLPLAIYVISDLLLLDATEANAENIAQFIFTAQSYAEANPSPAWLNNVINDAQFYNKLASEVRQNHDSSGVQALGVFDFIINPLAVAATKFKGAVIEASDTVLNKTGDFASTKLLAWGRKDLNANIGRFFGDVFVYLEERGDNNNPGDIPKRILNEIDLTITESPANEPLVVIGHSLGAVICFDLFSHFRPDITVDLFVSVGSQISHFEEIKRFKTSDTSIPSPQQQLAKTPANIKHWINVFDEVDIFAYACEKVFDRVTDFQYDTKTHTINAHGAYFGQDRFFQRLRTRMNELL